MRRKKITYLIVTFLNMFLNYYSVIPNDSLFLIRKNHIKIEFCEIPKRNTFNGLLSANEYVYDYFSISYGRNIYIKQKILFIPSLSLLKYNTIGVNEFTLNQKLNDSNNIEIRTKNYYVLKFLQTSLTLNMIYIHRCNKNFYLYEGVGISVILPVVTYLSGSTRTDTLKYHNGSIIYSNYFYSYTSKWEKPTYYKLSAKGGIFQYLIPYMSLGTVYNHSNKVQFQIGLNLYFMQKVRQLYPQNTIARINISIWI